MERIDPQNLPQQKNLVDCGLYLLKFVEVLLQSPPPEVRAVLSSMFLQANMKQDFTTLYPSFELRIQLQRQFIRAALKKETEPDRWKALIRYERNTGRSKPSEDAIVAAARRPRRFSEERKQPRRVRRASEPSDGCTVPPPVPS